jgi:hypothetical protein
MEIKASSFKLRANAPKGQKRFPISGQKRFPISSLEDLLAKLSCKAAWDAG